MKYDMQFACPLSLKNDSERDRLLWKFVENQEIYTVENIEVGACEHSDIPVVRVVFFDVASARVCADFALLFAAAFPA